jgi:hypothetical protein
VKVGNLIVSLSSAVFALTLANNALAEDMQYLAHLSPITAAPSNLLCTKPQEFGVQYLACDAYKDYGEPISPVTHLSSTKLAIRFMYIPSFHTWSVVRVEISTDNYGKDDSTAYPEGTITVLTQTEDGSHAIRRDRAPTAKVSFVRTYKLQEDEVWLILLNVNLADAFALPSTRDETVGGCVDGTQYVIELAESTRYHWAVLSCRYKSDPREDSLYRLSSLLALIVRSYASQDLEKFPGD